MAIEHAAHGVVRIEVCKAFRFVSNDRQCSSRSIKLHFADGSIQVIETYAHHTVPGIEVEVGHDD